MKTIKIGDDPSVYATGNDNCKTSTTGTSDQKPKELDWVERLENILGNREDLIKQLVGKIPEDKIIEGLKYFDETKRQLDELIQSLLTQQRTELLEEIIKLSDKIEVEGSTKFEEWKAFKHFRNTLRDKNY